MVGVFSRAIVVTLPCRCSGSPRCYRLPPPSRLVPSRSLASEGIRVPGVSMVLTWHKRITRAGLCVRFWIRGPDQGCESAGTEGRSHGGGSLAKELSGQ